MVTHKLPHFLLAILLLHAVQVDHAHAATKKNRTTLTAEQKTQIVNQSIKVVNKFLTQAKNRITTDYNTISSIQATRSALDKKENTLKDTFSLATKEHDKNVTALSQALTEDYKIQTTSLIIPRITDLHQTFLAFVDRYRAQAGLVPGSPEYIEGHPVRSTRPAMAAIVSAQDKDLIKLKQTVQNISNFVKTIESELTTLSNNPNDQLARFGFDHYYTRLLQRFEAQRTIAQTITSLFNGLDSNYNSVAPLYRCDQTSAVATFNQNANKAYLYSLNQSSATSYNKVVNEEIVLDFYVGNQAKAIPGWINSWKGCSQNKQANVENYKKDIEREIVRKNIGLAKQLDLARGDLEYEIAIINAETEVMTHFSTQFSALMSTVGIQSTTEITNNYPNAWRKTAQAFISNLVNENEIYPELMHGADLLLIRAINEITSLQGITDPQNRQAELKLIADKLSSIRNSGFVRLIEQFDSVNDQVSTMSRSISGGEVFLDETMNNYARSAGAKATYWQQEESNMSQTLADSNAKVVQARNNFDYSLELKKHTENTAKEFSTTKTTLYQKLDLLLNKFGNAKFNPLYSELGSSLFTSIASHAQYPQLKTDLKNKLTSFLSSFKGIKSPAFVDTSAAKVKKKRDATSSYATELEKSRKKMAKTIDAQIDHISRSYLNGISLSAAIDELKQLSQHINSIDN